MADQMPDAPYGKPYFEEIRADNLHPESSVGSGAGAVTLESMAALVGEVLLSSGSYAINPRTGLLEQVTLSPLPDGLTLNGSIYMCPDGVALPDDLSSNGGIVMTDGSRLYENAYYNGGVLCAP
ncbi:hypothetical protein AZ09_04130 [Acetobacter aceti 1023]|nr:hypothetical protein AZ09_04130 [Acetobacter aceti 1023]